MEPIKKLDENWTQGFDTAEGTLFHQVKVLTETTNRIIDFLERTIPSFSYNPDASAQDSDA